LLRAHIEQGAARLRNGNAAHRIRYCARDAKIGQFQAASPVDHQVRRFEIPMDDTFAMSIFQRITKLVDERFQVRPRENSVLLLHAQRAKVRSVHIFHRDERILVFRFVKIVNAQNVRVSKPLAARRFAAEIVEGRGIKPDVRGEKF
jgi:hypothetical protein